MNLNETVVVITGGFGTVGLATGRAAALQGARVALIDRAATPDLAALPEELSNALLLGNVDLTSSVSAGHAFGAVASHFKGIDVLANVAGAFRWQTLAEGSLEVWDYMYNTNLKTAMVSCKAALPYLQKSRNGRVVNIGAGSAIKAGAGMGAYAASKAGVAKLTESLAEELKDQGITVNAVLPSIVDTPQNRIEMATADFSRWVAPDALADVIMFLASAKSRAITGALIPVSGRV